MNDSLFRLGSIVLAAATLTSPVLSQDDPVVMSFADIEAHRAEVEDWLIRHRGESFIPTFVVWHLARAEAQERGLTPDPADVKARVEGEIRTRVDGAFGGDEAGWREELRDVGRSAEGYRLGRTIELEAEQALAALALADRVVTDEQLQRTFEAQYGPGGRRFDARVLYLPLRVDPIPGETAAETRVRRNKAQGELEIRMKDLRQTIVDGADFAEVAKRESKDPASARHGGRNPNGFDTTRWPTVAKEQVQALALNELSEPIFALGGFWIIRPEEETVTPFESVADELRERLTRSEATSAEVNAKRQELWEKATITVLPSQQNETGPADEAVLDISGETITRATYGRWLRHFAGELLAKVYAEERVVAETAAKRGIQVTAEEIDQHVERHIQREVDAFYLGDRDSWRRKTLKGGQDEASFKRRAALWTRVNLLVEKMLREDRTVSENELRRAWEEIHGPGGRRVEIRWIRLDVTPPPADDEMTQERWDELVAEALQQLEQDAVRLRKRILAGEDFGALARKHSTDEITRSQGGTPPEGFRLGQLPPELSSVVEPLGAGDVSQPVTFRSAVYLFEVAAIREVPFEKARDEIHELLMARQPTDVEVAERKLALMRDVEIQILPAMLR